VASIATTVAERAALKIVRSAGTRTALQRSATFNSSSSISPANISTRRRLSIILVLVMTALQYALRANWHGQTAINECLLGIELGNDNSGRDTYPPEDLASPL
jgi:hypothetical protein